MKNSEKKSESLGIQNTNLRTDKKKANLRWNSRLYFQIGLIVSLFLAFLAMEATIGYKVNRAKETAGMGLEEPPVINYTVEKIVPVPVKVPVKKTNVLISSKPKQVLTDVIKVVENTTVIEEETKIAAVDAPIVDIPVAVIEPAVTNQIVNINSVEFVPIFPGCEYLTSNAEKKECMSEKISAFISKKFDADRFADSNVKGKQRIDVLFKIDTNGNITDVVARAPNAGLEKEASRVVSQLPKMTPGRQGKTNVSVQYMVPITFQLEQ